MLAPENPMSKFLPLLGALLLAVPSLHAGDSGDDAVAAVTKLGGRAYRESPAHPVLSVSLRDAKVTDGDLKGLAALPGLQSVKGLDLGLTEVTDAGVKELAAFRE